jgi:YVTN family beta-propeller protein
MNPKYSHVSSRRLATTLIAVPVLLFFADVPLVLWKVRLFHFVSVPVWEYVIMNWSAFTAALAIAAVVGTAVRIAREILSGRKFAPPSVDAVAVGFGKFLKNRLSHPAISIFVTVVLMAVGVAAIWLEPDNTLVQPISSTVAIIATKNPAHAGNGRLYIAATARGVLLVSRTDAHETPMPPIPIGTHGNEAGHGAPEQIIEYKHNGLHLLFVTDPAHDVVHIVDVEENAELRHVLPVSLTPRSMAITPDGRKLFVSAEQPAPTGSVQVFDTSGNDPTRFHFVAKIGGVGCPEGLALSPRGDRLYVASQCGGNHDAVFVIDTATNTKIATIPDLAVGTAVALNRDGSRLYVSRGNFPCMRPDGSPGSPLTVVDTASPSHRNTICLNQGVESLALDPNGRFLFVGNGHALGIFETSCLDTATSPQVEIPLEAEVRGIAVTGDGSAYAFIPKSGRIFMLAPVTVSCR